MALKKVAGADLEFGVKPVTGCVAQSGKTSAGGELKTYRDENGNYLALYVDDEHKKASFNGILKKGQAENKKIGDKFEALGVSGYLDSWEVEWANNDVAKVSGSLRSYQGL